MAHSESGEARMDFIYFGGTDCVLFFEVTVAKDVRTSKYPRLADDDDRLDLIFDRMKKWVGHTIRVTNGELKSDRDFKGALEYIVVSSRTTEDGILHVGNRKQEKFPWIKVMDCNNLKSVFPEAHIDRLAVVMTE